MLGPLQAVAALTSRRDALRLQLGNAGFDKQNELTGHRLRLRDVPKEAATLKARVQACQDATVRPRLCDGVCRGDGAFIAAGRDIGPQGRRCCCRGAARGRDGIVGADGCGGRVGRLVCGVAVGADSSTWTSAAFSCTLI